MSFSDAYKLQDPDCFITPVCREEQFVLTLYCFNSFFFFLFLDPSTALPRPPTLSSVPSLLTSLQNEYDTVMLELFTLKRSYDNVRQELAHALYANDSANRVVARLMWERDEARNALASIKDSLGQGGSTGEAGPQQDSEMAEATNAGGLPPAARAKVDETSKV